MSETQPMGATCDRCGENPPQYDVIDDGAGGGGIALCQPCYQKTNGALVRNMAVDAVFWMEPAPKRKRGEGQ